MQITQSIPARKASQGDIEDFIGCCDDHAWFYANGWIELQTAVDNLQHLAELWGLVDAYGQDRIQRLIAYPPSVEQRETSEYAAAYVQRIIAQWEANDATRLRTNATPSGRYRTPQSTIDAFFLLTRHGDAGRLARWLAEHPRDVSFLTQIWERKCSTLAA